MKTLHAEQICEQASYTVTSCLPRDEKSPLTVVISDPVAGLPDPLPLDAAALSQVAAVVVGMGHNDLAGHRAQIVSNWLALQVPVILYVRAPTDSLGNIHGENTQNPSAVFDELRGMFDPAADNENRWCRVVPRVFENPAQALTDPFITQFVDLAVRMHHTTPIFQGPATLKLHRQYPDDAC